MNENFKKTTIKLINGEDAIIMDSDKLKVLKSENYNFLFKKDDGFFARWGKTKEDDGDPEIGLPEIADIEIDTACKQNCSFCYKANNKIGEYMSLETFKKIFEKITKIPSITQIAFGITDIDSNPYMWDIFDWAKSHDIVPNVTINASRMTSELYDKLAKTMGAVAVSVGVGYNKNNSYNAIKELCDRGMTQVNIHNMICMENFDYTIQLIKDCKTDIRLKNLGALVFLSLKTKGRAEENGFTQLPQEKFDEICEFALKENIRMGFDSCGSHKFLAFLKKTDSLNDKQKQDMSQSVECCESSCYSLYIDVKGNYFPCSFTPNTKNWERGINIIESEDFIKDVWQNEKTVKFRKNLIGCGRDCPIYKI